MRVDGPRRETQRVSLTFCDGRPLPAALDTLSVLARPHRTPAPETRAIRAYARRLARRPRRGETRPDPGFIAEGVRRIEAGLLPRVARVAARFPGKAIEIVSGWRPTERASSRHHQARALDLRVRGVSREALRDFARTLDETGIGYYPNSAFVHLDVRDTRAYWVDRSGPGEEADYGVWPPPPEVQQQQAERIVAEALATLEALRAPPADAHDAPGLSVVPGLPDAPATDGNARAHDAPADAPTGDATDDATHAERRDDAVDAVDADRPRGDAA